MNELKGEINLVNEGLDACKSAQDLKSNDFIMDLIKKLKNIKEPEV